MIYCRNKECPHNKECEPYDFQFSTRITPLYPNIVDTCCGLKQPEISDVAYDNVDFRYEIALCEGCEGVCNKTCLWNEEGKCTRENILIEFHIDKDYDAYAICRCYSRKNISGHLDWSRFPQGGNIDSEYADKLNNDATKFKLFTGSSKGYNRGEHGSKHDARELPSILQKQAKEREKDQLREKWEREHATHNIRIRK